jgi:hypothetical protein
MIKRWIYELVVAIDEDERDALGVAVDDEEAEILSSLREIPFIADVEVQYAITQEALHDLENGINPFD